MIFLYSGIQILIIFLRILQCDFIILIIPRGYLLTSLIKENTAWFYWVNKSYGYLLTSLIKSKKKLIDVKNV